MRISICLLIAMLFVAPMAFAQQDPDDPGIQDSIILGQIVIDSGVTFAGIPLYAVTDDSVAFYNMPLRWIAPLGGILPRTPHTYFPPLTSWDERFDTVIISQNYIRQIGFADVGLDTFPNPPLMTNGHRIQIMTLAFNIDPGAYRQTVIIDTTWDDRCGSVMFGLIDGITEITPAFVRGHIIYVQDPSSVNDPKPPTAFNLGQNYPNPFNPSTEIRFALAQDGQASLVIYDLLGREVRRLLDTRMNSGNYSLRWDGKDASGVDVPSGVYLYKLTSLGFSESKRMTLIR